MYTSFYLRFGSLILLMLTSMFSSIIAFPLSAVDKDIITQNQDIAYIYLGSEQSTIIKTLSQIADLAANGTDSPLSQFNDYVATGAAVASYDTVIDILEYAEGVLQNDITNDVNHLETLKNDFAHIIQQVITGKLTVSRGQDYQGSNILALPASLEIFNIDPLSDSLLVKRLVALTPALIVATSNTALSGLSTIDGVSLNVNDRVLLVNQTVTTENGLWQAQSGSWTRPTDFATGNIADQSYVLISSGNVNAGSSWLCTTPTAVIDTDPITFVLFAYADITLGTNVGSGTGLIFRDKTGTILNFKSLIAGSDIVITNNSDDITIDTDAASNNTASTIVKRDASGNFSAGAVSLTDAVLSSSLTISPFSTSGIVHNNASGNLSSSLIVNADIASGAAIADSKLATISTAGKVNNSATTANMANLANAIVARDASGNFFASTITANLNGNAMSATTATTATTATSFSGPLVGDVTGTQGATVVSSVGGQIAANVASATVLANAATSNNTASSIVSRDASGRFSAGIISVTDEVISSSLTITPLNTAGVVHNSAAGLLSTSLIVNADISASAAIADSKLATISTAGKVANSATTATGLNTANTIVARDASGNFSASIVIANVLGSASNNLLKAGDIMTGALQLPAGTTAAPSLMFTGSTTAGLSAASGTLTFSTNALARMRISSGGAISINAFTFPGVIHNDASGNLSSSFIVNSDIAAGAGIIDSKLATISTTGKVANSATTATDANIANTIVKRDTLGNFRANVITVVDSTVSGNLTLSTNPSTSTAGNIFKGVNTPFIHNFGSYNTFIGENAGNFTMNGNGQNSAVGAFALSSNNTGDNNTAIGFATFPLYTDGTNNIAIGSGAGGNLTTGSGNIYINANAASGSESNATRIGTSQTQCFIAGIRGKTTTNNNAIAVLIDSAGQLGTISSSASVKHDIEDMNEASSNMLKLRPVTFVYNSDESNTTQFGLIAEEVEEIFPAIVAKNEEGRAETIQYHVLPVLLLNEMKKQQALIDEQQKNITEQALSIENLNITIETMNEAIGNLQAQVRKFIKHMQMKEC